MNGTMTRVKPILIATLSLLIVSQLCSAQLETLTPVEQGVTDVEPIARSLLMQPIDFRSSNGFEVLYQGTWTDPILGTREIFARRSGALTAVFPRSSYSHTQQGVIPEIPPGTIFYFGDALPEEVEPVDEADIESTEGRQNLRMDTRIGLEIQPWFRGQATLDLDANNSIWEDESYRQIRISRLLSRTLQEPQEEIAAEDPDS